MNAASLRKEEKNLTATTVYHFLNSNNSSNHLFYPGRGIDDEDGFIFVFVLLLLLVLLREV